MMPLWKTNLRFVLVLAVSWQAGCAETKQLQFATAPAGPTRADTVPGPLVYRAAQHRVVRVRDGDSLTLSSDQVLHEARLVGIDAPELRQEYGAAAKEALGELLRGREITFKDSGQDPYHRNLVRLYADGIDVNREMIRRGLAWWYRSYSHDPDLEAAELEARRFRRGLWSQRHPQPPWEWRRAHDRAPVRSGG
jgi:micrococcal nuclease